MKAILQVDKGSGAGIQVMKFGETTFDELTDEVRADVFDGDEPEIVYFKAVTDACWVIGENPSVPSAVSGAYGHYMAEGDAYPVSINGGLKVAVKGTIALSW